MLDTSAETALDSVPRASGFGFTALFAVSIGVIVAQLGIVSLMQGVGIGGWGFFVALIAAFGLAVANAMAYAEMALMMPRAESLSSYVEAAVGNFPAILLVFAGYITPVIFGIPVELILVDWVLQQIAPGVFPHFGWAIGLLGVLVVLNLLGTDIFARVQTALSFVMLIFMIMTAAVALSHGVRTPAAVGGFASLNHNVVVVGVIALAFWVFVGAEFVTPMVVMARSPNRDLPRAMLLGLLAVFVVQGLFALGAVFLLPRDQLVNSAAPHLDYVVAVFGPSAKVWFGAIAIISTASLVNTVLGAVPRMLHGMAMNGQVFPIFKRLDRRRGTPYIAILFIAALPLVGLAWSGGDPSAIIPLTVAASVAWLLAYVTAQVSLIVLRHRHGHLARPFKVPGYPFVPLLAIAGMVFVMINSAPTPEMAPQIARYTGIVLALFAVVGGVWVKLIMKKGLFEPTTPTRWGARTD